MICWGLGGFGLGVTGVLDANTKEDLGADGNDVRPAPPRCREVAAGVRLAREVREGLNVLTSSAPVLPDAAVDIFGFSAGQATFDASIDVAPLTENVGSASGGPGSAGPRPEEGSRP